MKGDSQRSALLVFAKVPQPGFVKTRLAETISERDAAALYRAFLQDAIRSYATLPFDVHLLVATATAGRIPEFLRRSVPGGRVYEQQGAGLGDRMASAFDWAFSSGYDRVAIVGTDLPTLPLEQVAAGLLHLRNPADLTIGPTDDGGYYLLGLRRPCRGLFSGMRFGHNGVYAETLNRAKAAGLHTVALERWYDVDDAGTLRRLLSDPKLGEPVCAATRRALRLLLRRHPNLVGPGSGQ